jgi:hypothetical protein
MRRLASIADRSRAAARRAEDVAKVRESEKEREREREREREDVEIA